MSMAKGLIGFLDRLFYNNLGDNWDHQIFRTEILKYIHPDTFMLDVGAGSGLVSEMDFKGLAGQVYGIDPDRRVLDNPYLNKAFVGFGDSMRQFEDNRFDVVICCNVLEHIPDPAPFFNEVRRVLKNGGFLITKTPNKFHYVPLIAMITPSGFHQFINKIRGRKGEDTFPTFYHANTKKQQMRIAQATGFEITGIQLYEGRPEYLRVNFLLYIPGIIYERLVNLLHLDCLKVVVITTFKKVD